MLLENMQINYYNLDKEKDILLIIEYLNDMFDYILVFAYEDENYECISNLQKLKKEIGI